MISNRAKANRARMIDITGETFNRLTVVSKNETTGWDCVCSCGNKVFRVTSDKLKSGNTKSCGCLQKEKASTSMKNLLAARRESCGLTANDNLSDVRLIERAKFKPVRIACFERDSYTCVWCSRKGFKLNAHHLKPWASNPDLRFDLSNVVTLCRECHSKVHNHNYHGELNHHMNILLCGYVEAYCFRKEVS